MATKAGKPRRILSSPTREEAPDNTRDRILDVAERLFAERGIENVTLRDVTSAANVNLAAIHYHFGSREELLRAILARRMTPLLEDRLRRLALPSTGDAPAARLDHIVRAFIQPSMDYDCSGDNYLIHRLMTRLAIYEELHPTDVFQFLLADNHARFIERLAEVRPDLDRNAIGYRFEFMLGLLTHATALRAKLIGANRPIHGITDPDRLVDELAGAIIALFLS